MIRLGQTPPPPLRDADLAFRGMDAFNPPEMLEPGWVQYAENVRIEAGRIGTRAGLSWVFGGGDVGVGFPVEFPVDWGALADRKPWATGQWKDPADEEWVIRVFKFEARLSRQGRPDKVITYPAGEFVTGPARLLQVFDQMVLLRGTGGGPLLWDGSAGAFVDYPGGNIAQDAFDGVYVAGRLWLLFGRDRVQYSDVLSTSFDTFSEFYVNRGESDSLVRLFAYNQRTLLAFKNRSIYAVQNVVGDPAANAELTVVSNSRGTIAPDSVADVGPDVFFLSEGGVFALSMVDETRAQLRDVPVSRAIGPVIERINWSYAHRAKAVYDRNRYYLAVPIDGAKVNNAVLVFNVLLGAWESVDVFPGVNDFGVDGWVRFWYLGETRLAVQHPSGFLLLYGYNPLIDQNPAFDVDNGPEAWVPVKVRTRRYMGGSPERKRWTGVRLTLETLAPRLTVTVDTPGVGEAFVAAEGLTRVPGRSMSWAQTLDSDNTGGGWEVPWREDYYIDPLAGGFALGTAGVRLQRPQHWTLPVPVRRASDCVELEIVNDRGTVALSMVEAGAVPAGTSRVKG